MVCLVYPWIDSVSARGTELLRIGRVLDQPHHVLSVRTAGSFPQIAVVVPDQFGSGGNVIGLDDQLCFQFGRFVVGQLAGIFEQASQRRHDVLDGLPHGVVFRLLPATRNGHEHANAA